MFIRAFVGEGLRTRPFLSLTRVVSTDIWAFFRGPEFQKMRQNET